MCLLHERVCCQEKIGFGFRRKKTERVYITAINYLIKKMKIDNRVIIGLLVVVLVSLVLSSTLLNKPVLVDTEASDLEVTVYNSNLGVVKEYRDTFLHKGLNDVLYKGVASGIDTTSVKLKSLDGVIDVWEQNYRYDLVNMQKILEKYIDHEITAYQVYGDKKELVEGTLLSFSGNQIILQDLEGNIKTLSTNNFVLPELPEGLITKPTLEWLIEADEERNHTLELSYMTSGMSWRADYVLVTNEDDTMLDLNGWVTVTNNAGTTFRDASLKLVAGDVNRVWAPSVHADALYAAEVSKSGMSQFAEESLFEYHMYDLQRKTTLRDREQKQVSLLESSGVDVEKEYVYDDIRGWWWYGSSYSSTGDKKIDVMLNFINSEENNLGIPLPAGIMRVFKEDSGGKLQFIGEDSIDHTPKDETLRIFVGQAFDIVGERKQMDFNLLSQWYEYTWEVELRNHKDEDITVTVVERTGGDWNIVQENVDHVKESNNVIKWRVPVKANDEAKLTYTIRYKRY